jgi:hypothetical protein
MSCADRRARNPLPRVSSGRRPGHFRYLCGSRLACRPSVVEPRGSGKWQGPLGVPRGSIVICIGLGSPADDLATELLVRLLRSERIDARHFSSTDINAGLPPGADPDGVAIAILVSAFPSSERDRAEPVGLQLQTFHVCSPCGSMISTIETSTSGATPPTLRRGRRIAPERHASYSKAQRCLCIPTDQYR